MAKREITIRLGADAGERIGSQYTWEGEARTPERAVAEAYLDCWRFLCMEAQPSLDLEELVNSLKRVRLGESSGLLVAHPFDAGAISAVYNVDCAKIEDFSPAITPVMMQTIDEILASFEQRDDLEFEPESAMG